jgi:hypothetical protein
LDDSPNAKALTRSTCGNPAIAYAGEHAVAVPEVPFGLAIMLDCSHALLGVGIPLGAV